MKKILLSTVVFFSFSQQAYAWDWLNRQIDALPEMPRMSSFSKMYGMDKKIAPSDMVVKEENAASGVVVSAPVTQEDVPVIQNAPAEPYYRPADKTISGEERIVLQDDSIARAPVKQPAPALTADEEDFVIRSSDAVPAKNTGADDVMISSSATGPLPPTAVINMVKGNPVANDKEQTDIPSAAPERPAILPPEESNRVLPLPVEEKAAFPEQPFLSLQHCQGYGCRVKTDVALSREDWALTTRAFNLVPIETPEQERTAIAIYIGEMEKLVGVKTGTTPDKGGTFKGFAEGGQMDCGDESSNTTAYLKFLNNLKFYDVGEIAGRGFFTMTGGWPHQTATIVEKKTGKVYAVDSWFEDNGRMPHIITLDEWKTGWSPDGTVEEQAVTSDMIAPSVPKVRAVKE